MTSISQYLATVDIKSSVVLLKTTSTSVTEKSDLQYNDSKPMCWGGGLGTVHYIYLEGASGQEMLAGSMLTTESMTMHLLME